MSQEQPTANKVCVWFEIPVTDMEKSKRFYGAVMQCELIDEQGGPNPMAHFPIENNDVVSGHIYPGKPAQKGQGPTVHLHARGSVEEALERVTQAGGEVLSPIITIPAGRFAYCHDLDGNSIGIFGA